MSSHTDAHASRGHHVAHHFTDADHEFTTCKQGMWLFLLQEVLFFAPFFVGYFVYRGLYMEAFHEASHHLDWKLGALNTVFLLSSSYTMAAAVNAAQRGLKNRTVNFLIFTFLFAIGFLVVKYFE